MSIIAVAPRCGQCARLRQSAGPERTVWRAAGRLASSASRRSVSSARRASTEAAPVTTTTSPGLAPPRVTTASSVCAVADDGHAQPELARGRQVAAGDDRAARLGGGRDPVAELHRTRRRSDPWGGPPRRRSRRRDAPIAARSESAAATALWPTAAQRPGWQFESARPRRPRRSRSPRTAPPARTTAASSPTRDDDVDRPARRSARRGCRMRICSDIARTGLRSTIVYAARTIVAICSARHCAERGERQQPEQVPRHQPRRREQHRRSVAQPALAIQVSGCL